MLISVLGLISAITGFATMSFAQGSVGSRKSKELTTLAASQIDAKNYEAALKNLKAAIALDPRNADAYYQLAAYYDSKEDYQNTILNATKAIELNPKYAAAYFGRAVSYAQDKKWNEALSDVNNALKFGFDAAACYALRGNINGGLKRPQEEIADYRKALEIDPNSYSAKSGLKSALMRQRSQSSQTGVYQKISAADMFVIEAAKFAAGEQSKIKKANFSIKSIEIAEVSDLLFGTDYRICAKVDRPVEETSDDGKRLIRMIVSDDIFSHYTLESWKEISKCDESETNETSVAQTTSKTPVPVKSPEPSIFDFSKLSEQTKKTLEIAAAKPSPTPSKTPAPIKSNEPLNFDFDKLSAAKTESEIKTVLDKYAKLIKENPSRSVIYLARADFFGRLIDYNKMMADLMRYANINADSDYHFLIEHNVAGQMKLFEDYTIIAGLKFLDQKSTAREYLEQSLASAQIQVPESLDFALKDAAEALSRNPALTSAHLVRGKILIQKGKMDEGIAEANAALAQEADNVGALCIRAIGYAIKNDFSHSLDDLNRAIALDPELASLYNAFGTRMQIYKSQGKNDLAAADLLKAQQLANIVGKIQQMK